MSARGVILGGWVLSDNVTERWTEVSTPAPGPTPAEDAVRDLLALLGEASREELAAALARLDALGHATRVPDRPDTWRSTTRRT